MNEVMSVLGPVKSDELGITLPHEHIFIDLSCLWHDPIDEKRKVLVDAKVAMSNRALLMSDPYHCRDNLVLSDLDTACQELNRFKDLGGATVLDLSTRTIGPYPEKLAEVSRRTGLNIIAGTGFYTKRAHPDYLKDATVLELAQQMISELSEGFPGTKIRAGVIGELGSSSPLHPAEIKVLEAAAKAHLETGVGINVHLAIFGREGHTVLDILEKEQVNLQRVALSHLDEAADYDYNLSLAKRGAFLEFDCFGSELYFDEDNLREPSDAERLESLLRLLDAGYEQQLLLSQDVCTKMQLRSYAGMGYDHLLRTIVPRLKKHGLSNSVLESLFVSNPRRFLTGNSGNSE